MLGAVPAKAAKLNDGSALSTSGSSAFIPNPPPKICVAEPFDPNIFVDSPPPLFPVSPKVVGLGTENIDVVFDTPKTGVLAVDFNVF